MKKQIITIFRLCDDYIRSINHIDHHNVKWSTSEVITCWIVAMKFFYSNVNRARIFLLENQFIKRSFTLSALIKRIHKIPDEYWTDILEFIQSKDKNGLSLDYIVDSFPIPACHNIRIQRCRLFEGEAFRGYNASKKVYFYGLKATVITTSEGCPVRVVLSPGREHDSVPFRVMNLNLPKGSVVYGDSAYQDKKNEEKRFLEEETRIIAERKSNSSYPISLEDFVNLKKIRKTIETTFSMITSLMPRKIHAVTPEGFELKILGFILAIATKFIMN